MKVFISWSGERSKMIADALYGWLQQVIQALEPFMSARSIAIGASFSEAMKSELQATWFGIFCMTPENLSAPWIMFEAGAISKMVSEKSFVCPYLFEIEPAQLVQPLAAYQGAPANEEGTWKLLESINHSLGEKARPQELLKESFQKWWPDLKTKLEAIPKSTTKSDPNPNKMIEEILFLVRTMSSEKNDEIERLKMNVENAFLSHLGVVLSLDDTSKQIVRRSASNKNLPFWKIESPQPLVGADFSGASLEELKLFFAKQSGATEDKKSDSTKKDKPDDSKGT